ncbi:MULTISPECIES: lichenicidin A2 family type 2 lantibiotic [Carnobacterium]|uniref:lichenicidin A2 family type 2 lantibiotic n=1 Tax=Carnobacterium TaxID=2747 RepID=UPI0035E23FD3
MINLENKELHQFVGQAFEELSIESMEQLQGSSDISPRTTLPCLESAVVSYEIITMIFCKS